MTIGDTRSIVGMFTIMAVLRELGRWIDGVFSSWLRKVFLCEMEVRLNDKVISI